MLPDSINAQCYNASPKRHIRDLPPTLDVTMTDLVQHKTLDKHVTSGLVQGNTDIHGLLLVTVLDG